MKDEYNDAGYGPWETCPYTGRRRRIKLSHSMLAKSLGDGVFDKRTPEQIRIDIENMIDNPDGCNSLGQPYRKAVNQLYRTGE